MRRRNITTRGYQGRRPFPAFIRPGLCRATTAPLLFLILLPGMGANAQGVPAATGTGSAGAMSNNHSVVEEGFEHGLKRWRTRGPAEFAVVSEHPRSGRSCLRIRVPEAAPLRYQQAWTEGKIRVPGQEVSASAFVRTRDVRDGTGAYMYVEFLAGARRISIVHSKTGRRIGAAGWQPLAIDRAPAPTGCDTWRVGLVLHAHGTAWFDDVTVRVTSPPPLRFQGDHRRFIVFRDRIVSPRFGGVGFHVFYHLHSFDETRFETVLAKRWLELRPSYARITHRPDWTENDLDRVARALSPLRRTGTDIYVTTWGPRKVPPGPERDSYVRMVVDHLEYLIRRKGFTGIRLYCMTNELSLGRWGALRSDLPTFRDYHQRFFRELRERRLDVGLLATDASPVSSWWTIEWAVKHMDDITAAYGGHHYFNRYLPDNPRFYFWFLEQCGRGVGYVRRTGKPFILGEFGCKQDGRTIGGVKMDACVFWGTALEPLVGVQLAEAVFAAMNAGVYAMCNWTFADFPDEYNPRYKNKWGVFRWSGSDNSTRPHYYAYGELTRWLRGPGTVHAVESNDPLVRGTALRDERGRWTVALVSRNSEPVTVGLHITDAREKIRLHKFTYDPHTPPSHPYGDLPPPDGSVVLTGGRGEVTIPAGSLVVLTARRDDRPPAPPTDARILRNAVTKSRVLTWRPADANQVIYFRIWRSRTGRFSDAEQIGSTAGTSFRCPPEDPPSAALFVQSVSWDGVPSAPAVAEEKGR